MPYVVLARKYRSRTFEQMVGQEHVVRALTNALTQQRLHHAYLFTGTRGVGKTTVSRILAKCLNCTGADGQGGPTIAPCGVCDACVSIGEGRHIDVVEMDAASNTGVDDVREIIEAVRYATVSARFKIYIIDEVHMLSKNAFNALLKTLEEPPPHVKFIFATTEVQKVPVTILSRCQRFDLRRIPAEMLAAHFARIAELEQVSAEPEALALIARAAEGSVRDGLSILDQAIAHGAGNVSAAAVRDMLGLSDRGMVRGLLALLLAGDGAGALKAFAEAHDLGTDPAQLLGELLALVHLVTRAKVAGATDPALSEEERAAVADWAARLDFSALHRLWQLLLKGLSEVQAAPVPAQAAEMALLRLIHASSLPDPGELVRKLSERGIAATPREAPAGDTGPGPHDLGAADHGDADHGDPGYGEPAPVRPLRAPVPVETVAAPADFAALVLLFETRREPRLAQLLHDEVRLVDYTPPALTVTASEALPADFAARVMACLSLWTGARWTVTLARAADHDAAPTLLDQAIAAEAAMRAAVLADPAVQAVFSAFPGAELLDITTDEPAEADEGSESDAQYR